MSSIADNQQTVKSLHETKVQDFKNCVKWAHMKGASRKMAGRLFAAGLKDRAARMWQCGDYLVVHPSTTGEVVADSPMLCHDRLCAVCSWLLSRRRFAEMMAVFNALSPEIIENGYKATMLTLTIRNMPLCDLRKSIDAMADAWHNLIRREAFREVVGWARSLEITYNKQADTYHPHMHVILMWRSYDDTPLMSEYIRDAWRRSAKLDYDPQTDIRPVYSADSADGELSKSSIIKSALEAFKYAVKPDSASDVPQKDLFEFAGAIKGVRFVSYGKAIKRARQALGFKNDDMPETPDVVNTLPDSTVIAIMAWNGTAYTKAALTSGKFRLSSAQLQCAIAAADEGVSE